MFRIHLFRLEASTLVFVCVLNRGCVGGNFWTRDTELASSMGSEMQTRVLTVPTAAVNVFMVPTGNFSVPNSAHIYAKKLI